MKEIRTSAKDIAELLFGSGDLSSERLLQIRALEGTQIHQEWQRRYLPTDEAEVFVKDVVKTEDFVLEVTGRIDGILHRESLILEEIKSTRISLESLDEETHPAHFVQAKLYAYLYAKEHSLSHIDVHVIYIHAVSRESKIFSKQYTLSKLEIFYEETIHRYLAWLLVISNHEATREKSIQGLTFPFPEYRIGQRELMAYVYRNILDKGILYATAPTGIGKTMATLFASLKAINDYRQKVFYLTAKNDGKRVVLEAIRLLEQSGLVHKSVEITAKDRMCLLSERDCDPLHCPYAKGYFSRVFRAIESIYRSDTLLTKEKIKEYGLLYQLCPFELSLDLSNYADIVICDYNYAFDPRAHLIRYFEDTTYQPILLIDEAHNLVSRSREMYSQSISRKQLQDLYDLVRGLKPSPKMDINRLLDTFELFEIELLEVDFVKKDFVHPPLLLQLNKLIWKLDQALLSETKIPNKSKISEHYFDLIQFVRMAELFNESFVFLLEHVDKDLVVSIKCLNASHYLLETIQQYCKSAVFFSATLEPIHYYKSLLTQSKGTDVKFPSSFPQENLLLYIVDEISTRYLDREQSVTTILSFALAMISPKKGNYIIFFPSYLYLNMVKEVWEKANIDAELIIQRRDMSILEREETMSMFTTDSMKTQVAFFVMGGVFGESIDLIGDQLSGVMIIGVGLPMVAPFNNVLRSHYDETFQSGFDFAYTYPGLNKVIQAVGRVIRTEQDRGVAILLDDRFASRKYLSMYPKHWSHLKIENDPQQMEKEIAFFWEEDSLTRT